MDICSEGQELIPVQAPSSYQYRELDDGSIRLMYLQPGKRDDVLQFRLEHHSLSQCPLYEALSYCWGDAGTRVECECLDGESIVPFNLTSNLWLALRQLRSVSTVGVFWIDQVCISQGDDAEKSRQIPLMGKIFYQAEQVVAWIGEATRDTDLVFDLVEHINSEYHRLAEEVGHDGALEALPKLRHNETADEWVAFRRFFDNSWFSRLWCFQEIALAQTPIIRCSQRIMPFHTLSLVYLYVEAHLEIMGSGDLTLMTICSGYRAVDDRIRTECQDAAIIVSFLNLVKALMPRKSTLPHDKIYGVLAIANDVEAAQFPISYTEPFRETFARASRVFIEQHSDLYVLRLVNITPAQDAESVEPRELPSWVPDFRVPFLTQIDSRAFHDSIRTRHGSRRLFNASGLSKASVFNEDPLRLTLEAVLLGRIASLSEPDGDVILQGSPAKASFTKGPWFELAESCSVEGVYGPTSEPIALAHARLLVCDILPHQQNDSYTARILSTRAGADQGLARFSEDGDVLNDPADLIAFSAFTCTLSQRLFVTDTGYMGKAHMSCRVGDAVYVAMGADMPLVLRKLETDTYDFKGESYVHGAMGGEFLVRTFRSPDQEGEESHPLTDEQWLDGLGERPLPFPTEKLTLT